MSTPDRADPKGVLSPFHAGERAVQERAGVRAVMDRAGRAAIRNFMPDQHREFFEQLPSLIVGSMDSEHRPWASALFGLPGFIAAPDEYTLRVNATPVTGDPLHEHLVVGNQVGLLGLQPESRRRNRMNGPVIAADAGGFTVRVAQSFGNCPQYIWARAPLYHRDPQTAVPTDHVHAEGPALSLAAKELIAHADTFFIASAAPGDGTGHGVDVSHRGGKAGFVRIQTGPESTVLTSPDFSGNRYFNTLGNLLVNPRAGLLFVDFDRGSMLSLTGDAEIVWDGPDLEAFAGAERLVRFAVREGRRIEDALPFRWSTAQPAPQIAGTGTWSRR